MKAASKTTTLRVLLQTATFCFTAICCSIAAASAQTITIDSKKTLLEQTATYSDLHLFPNLHPTTNFTITFEFKTTKQYRKNPNPWETFWIFWSYNLDGNNNKFTNYLAFKTNGVEIGKAYDHVAQDFLYTSAEPQFEINKWHKIEFESKDSVLRLKHNDTDWITIPAEQIKNLYKTPGRLGLYAEDAQVVVRQYRLKIF